MPRWTLVRTPGWQENCIATPAGWMNPQTGEIVVAIRQLNTKRRDKLDGDVDNLTLGNGFDLILYTITTEQPSFLLLD